MKVYKYGANVDTDVIIPARHLNDPSPAALASHCMEDIDPDFASTVEAGDIVVAGPNFGCGSSREHAPLALKSCGVKCVIAPSFARIFYRNAIGTMLVWVMGRTMGAIGEGTDIIIVIPMDPKINELAGNFVTDGGLCSTDTVIRENNG